MTSGRGARSVQPVPQSQSRAEANRKHLNPYPAAGGGGAAAQETDAGVNKGDARAVSVAGYAAEEDCSRSARQGGRDTQDHSGSIAIQAKDVIALIGKTDLE